MAYIPVKYQHNSIFRYFPVQHHSTSSIFRNIFHHSPHIFFDSYNFLHNPFLHTVSQAFRTSGTHSTWYLVSPASFLRCTVFPNVYIWSTQPQLGLNPAYPSHIPPLSWLPFNKYRSKSYRMILPTVLSSVIPLKFPGSALPPFLNKFTTRTLSFHILAAYSF